MRQKIINNFLMFVLVAACLAACTIFMFLPFRSLNTELVYKGF